MLGARRVVPGTSEKTIEAHRGQVMRKMQAKSIVDLLSMATRLGDSVRDRLGEEVAHKRRRGSSNVRPWS